MTDEVIGEDQKHASGSHVSELFTEKLREGTSRRMVAPSHGGIFLLWGPWFGGEQDRYTFLAETLEQVGSTMLETTQVRCEVGSAPTLVVEVVPTSAV